MSFEEFKARTVGEAVTQACISFGVTSDRLEYTVETEGSSGFFGIGRKDAIIHARIRPEQEEEKGQPDPVSYEKPKKESKPEQPKKASSPKAERKESARLSESKPLSPEEIEARAAAAAARAKEQGEEYPVYSKSEYRERTGRRDRNDRSRSGRGRDRDRNDRERRGGSREAMSAPRAEAKKKAPAPKPDRQVVPKTPEEVEAMKAAAEAFLRDVFSCMDTKVDISMSYDEKEGCLSCHFSGEDMGILIGKRGQTLDSLQYLTSLIVNKNKADYTRVKLDTEDYRARRADTLENLARNIAYKVKRSRRPVTLEPMNPYERRIIHSALQGNKYVETYSEGEEPYRHVVVVPKRY